MKPRVTIDARALQDGFRDHKRRGIGFYAARLIRTIIPMANDLELSFLADPDLPPPDGLDGQQMIWARCGATLGFGLQNYLQHLLLRQRLTSSRTDLVHFLSHIDGTFALGVPVVVTVLDFIPNMFPTHHNVVSHYGRRLNAALQTAVVRQADAVIAISEATRRDTLKQARPAASRVDVVYLAADRVFMNHDAMADIAVCNRLGIPRHFYLYVGGIDPRKNIPRILTALSRTRGTAGDLPLVLAGRITNQPEYADLQARIKAGPGRDRVIEVGFVSDGDLAALYHRCSAFLFPSLYEGFGLPALEAMVAGAAVIVSDRGSLPEIVGDGGLVVDAENDTTIANAMIQLASDSALRAELAARGRIQAARFSWEATARETLAVYHRLLRSRGVHA